MGGVAVAPVVFVFAVLFDPAVPAERIGAVRGQVGPRVGRRRMFRVRAGVADAVVVQNESVLHIVARVVGSEILIVPVFYAGIGNICHEACECSDDQVFSQAVLFHCVSILL